MYRVTACFLAVAACGGSRTGPAKPAPSNQSADLAELVPTCQRIFARKATCADDYLPVLLDLRVELNRPPGIGDLVKEQGRDAILAQAHTELARDTEPAKVTALCEGAKVNASKAPVGRLEHLMGVARKCEAASDCKAFSTCVVTLDRVFISSAAAATPN